jgi:hypothetical protein
MGALKKQSRRRFEERDSFDRSQIFWTLTVALSVALAALYRLSTPGSPLISPTITTERTPSSLASPESLRR